MTHDNLISCNVLQIFYFIEEGQPFIFLLVCLARLNKIRQENDPDFPRVAFIYVLADKSDITSLINLTLA
ncbi:hypothetical protein AWB74_00397 [Caballeronia arvi]|uniref:Uncharacterized protein n=1 Tax=Caballeronia arvi TaxID=1777135 RepID=A0A158F6U9_9BURK|nr:hypothetical protein AWB74_00397 [Caballeronia arvi]